MPETLFQENAMFAVSISLIHLLASMYWAWTASPYCPPMLRYRSHIGKIGALLLSTCGLIIIADYMVGVPAEVMFAERWMFWIGIGMWCWDRFGPRFPPRTRRAARRRESRLSRLHDHSPRRAKHRHGD